MYLVYVLFWVRRTFIKSAKLVLFFQFFEKCQDTSLGYNFMLVKLTLPFNSEIFTFFEKINHWLLVELAIVYVAFFGYVKLFLKDHFWSHFSPAVGQKRRSGQSEFVNKGKILRN